MSKKFKNIENDEEFKNFKLEDYLPSISRREQEEKPSDSEQTPVEEAANLFPCWKNRVHPQGRWLYQLSLHTKKHWRLQMTRQRNLQQMRMFPENGLLSDASAASNAGCRWTSTVPLTCKSPR